MTLTLLRNDAAPKLDSTDQAVFDGYLNLAITILSGVTDELEADRFEERELVAA
jgi:hypothetical protein